MRSDATANDEVIGLEESVPPQAPGTQPLWTSDQSRDLKNNLAHVPGLRIVMEQRLATEKKEKEKRGHRLILSDRRRLISRFCRDERKMTQRMNGIC